MMTCYWITLPVSAIHQTAAQVYSTWSPCNFFTIA